MSDIKKVTLVIEHNNGKVIEINLPPDISLNATAEIEGYTYIGFINKVTNSVSWTTRQEIKSKTNRLKSYCEYD